MRRLLLAASLLTTLSCVPQAPVFPTTPVLPPAGRPGLLLDAADVPRLLSRIGRAPYSGWWSTVRALAEQAAGGSPGSATLSEETRARWAKAAAFAWVLTGDVRYRDAAALALGGVGTGPNAPLDDFGPNLGATSRTVLTASSHLQAACVAYDLVRSALTPGELALAEARLAAAAEQMYGQRSVDPSNQDRVNNWRIKAGAAIATAGLALPAGTIAPGGTRPIDWLGRGLAAIAQVLPVVAKSGWNREGVWYTAYSLGNLLPFAIHYRRASGQDVFPALEPLFAHALTLRQPNGRQPAIEDSPETDLPWGVAAPFLSLPGQYHAAWLSATSASTNFDNNDVKEVDEIAIVDDGIVPIPRADVSVLDAANSIAKLVATGGVTATLNGAADFENYFAGGGHTHADPLGLVVFAQGESLLVDAGYGPNGYSSPNRSYYVLAGAHNVLTDDGVAPWLTQPASLRAYLAAGAAGALASFETDYVNPFVPGSPADAHVRRSVLLAGPLALYVADEIVSTAPSTLAALFHARGTRTVVSEGGSGSEISWSRSRGAAPATRLRIVSEASQPISVARASGWYSELWGHEEALDYVRLEAAGATSLRVLSVLDLGDPSQAPLSVTRPACTGFECLEVSDGAGVDTLLLGDGATPLAAAGVEANARFARVRREGGSVTAAQIEEATLLRVSGSDVLHSERPASFSLARGAAQDVLVVSAPLTSALAVTVATSGAPPVRVRWSGVLDLAFTVSPGGEVSFEVPYAGTVTLER